MARADRTPLLAADEMASVQQLLSQLDSDQSTVNQALTSLRKLVAGTKPESFMHRRWLSERTDELSVMSKHLANPALAPGVASFLCEFATDDFGRKAVVDAGLVPGVAKLAAGANKQSTATMIIMEL